MSICSDSFLWFWDYLLWYYPIFLQGWKRHVASHIIATYMYIFFKIQGYTIFNILVGLPVYISYTSSTS